MRLYALVAPVYSSWVTIGSFGAFPAMYRRISERLPLQPGNTVLDLCCGTGLMTRHLAEKVGPTGTVIGVDLSKQMLGVAQHRARNLPGHIEFICADVTNYTPPAQVDGILFSIALSCIPDCEAVLERAVGFLRPGGWLILVDAFINQGRVQYALTNRYSRLKGAMIGADPRNQIRETAHALLEEVSIEAFHGGLYSLVKGRRPQA